MAALEGALPRIKGQTAATPALLTTVKTRTTALTEAWASRRLAEKVDSAARLEAQRAYSYLHGKYKFVRKEVHHLRFDEGDGDTIAPSLFGTLTPSRRKAEEKAPPPAPAPPPQGGPAPAPVTPSSDDDDPFERT